MQLDPTFISTYVSAALTYPDHYGSKTGYAFSCFESCSDCPFESRKGDCQIKVQWDLLGHPEISPGAFEQAHIAPLLRQSHPEVFI